MIYKAKEGSKAYNYIKDICEAEQIEKEAYFARVEQAVGFEVITYSGYQPNSCLIRKYQIEALLVDDETWHSLNHKLWKKKGVVQGYNKIVPIKRTKLGKKIAEVFNSFKPVATHFDIFNELNVSEPNASKFTITQLLYNKRNGTYFVKFDDSVRADKDNSDLEEITMSEYEKLMEE